MRRAAPRFKRQNKFSRSRSAFPSVAIHTEARRGGSENRGSADRRILHDLCGRFCNRLNRFVIFPRFGFVTIRYYFLVPQISIKVNLIK